MQGYLSKKSSILILMPLIASCSCNRKAPDRQINNLPDNLTQINPADLQQAILDPDEDLINYESGLKCKILRHGPTSGKLPIKDQLVTINYHCWQSKNGQIGTTIDDNNDESLTFKIGSNQMITAWDQAIMDMRIGDKWRLYIPTELSFGRIGNTKLTLSHNDLICDIELLAID